MAGKRRKKHAETEVTAAPNEAVTRGEVAVAPAKPSAVAPAAKVPTTRGDVGPTPAKLDTVVASPDAVAVTPDREEQIREHAYHIWKHAGEPHGDQDEHWILAEKQLQKG
jgi:hypothetical protein